MARRALTGTRIRERRLLVGLKQADLARQAGISPSYLNLIEHNRRKAGDALLGPLAAALGVDVAALAEGAGDVLLDGLRAAAATAGPPLPETDRLEEFVGRFPGWAALLDAQHQRITALEQTVERLTDRMTHDPHLSASLHEVLSAVTSVRSTAAILADTEDIDPDWRRRFHRNLQDDTERLAEGAEALVAYLDASAEEETGLASPQEEVEDWLAAQSYHIPALEEGGPAHDPGLGALATTSARVLARSYLETYARDAHAMPLPAIRAAVQAEGHDPGRLAARLGVDLPAIFRRLATLPDQPAGLVICDGSGTLTFRKPLEGFALPRFGAACPLWPLYQALSRPMVPIRAVVEMAGRAPRRFLTYAICQTSHPGGFEGPQVIRASMLILPAGPQDVSRAEEVGTSCRICPREDCPARREPSLMLRH